MARSGLRAKAMLQGILHQRLQDQRWNLLAGHSGATSILHLQAVAEARLLDIQVGAQKFDLVADRSQRAADCASTWRKTLARRSVIVSARGRVADDQVGDGIQRIEQEMRIDLRAQGA